MKIFVKAFLLVSVAASCGVRNLESNLSERVNPVANGNFSLDVPSSVPPNVKGSIWLKTAEGPFKAYEVSRESSVSIPPGKYYAAATYDHVSRYPVTVGINGKTVLKVSVIYSTVPLLWDEAYLSRYNCLPLKILDKSRPFAIFLPGEDQAGYQEILFGSQLCDGGHYVSTPFEKSSAFSIDHQLIIHKIKLDAMDPEYPDAEPLEVSGGSTFKVRNFPALTFGTPVYFKGTSGGEWVKFWMRIQVAGGWFDRPGYFTETFKRLEVNHLSTTEGSLIEGRFSVFKDGKKIVSGMPTKSGLDLPAGKYQVDVEGIDSQGNKVVSSHEVVL